MQKKARTFQARMLLVVIVLVVFTAMTIQFSAQRETRRAMIAAHDAHARNLLNAVVLDVENQYRSIRFFESSTLEMRKAELRDMVSIAIRCLARYHQHHVEGRLTEEEAKREALDDIENMRYDNGVGYLWVNDTGTPVPRMVMHPTTPELDGAILDDPSFNCAMGAGKNLFTAAVEICRENGSGYVDYLWPKPTEKGLTENLPKISYVELFEPWGWVVGTGVYVNDIEAETQKRFDAVVRDLEKTLPRVKITESGYLFIFTADQKVLVHPVMDRESDAGVLLNPVTGNRLLDEFMEAAKTPNLPFEYVWDRPENRNEYRFRKRAYIRHFEPLDWYIGASFYDAEMERPARELANRTLFLTGLILLVAVVLAGFVSRSVTKPLNKLTLAALAIEQEGISSAEIPISGTVETIELGTILSEMISSIKKSERDLKKANSYIGNIINSMPSVLVGVDGAGRVTQWNAAAERATGILAGEALGKPLRQVFPDMAADVELVREAIQNDRTLSVPKRARQVDNGTRYEDVTVYPLVADGVEGAVIRLDDVTERVEIEQERESMVEALEAQNAELERFAYTVSHDLKTPLITIKGYIGVLSEDLADGNRKSVADDVARISGAADKMAVLLNDVLQLSRIGRIVNAPQEVPLADLVEEALELVAKQIEQKNIRVNISQNLPVIYGDRLRLLEVVQNLLENAAKHMGDQPRPQIQIGSRRDGNETILYIGDNGKGIESQYHERVFGLFDQLDQSVEGTGIGLALVKRIIEVHGGRIWIESEGVGQGTTFCFTLAAKGESPK